MESKVATTDRAAQSEMGQHAERVTVDPCQIDGHPVDPAAGVNSAAGAAIGEGRGAEAGQTGASGVTLMRIVEQSSKEVDAFVGGLPKRIQRRRTNTEMAVIALLERLVGVGIQ